MTESGIKLIGWVVAACVAGGMLAMPQPVDPWEMPGLVLDREAVSDATGLDRALAREVPDSQEVRALRSLFLDHGRAEADPPYTRIEYDQRQADIYGATRAVLAKHGPLTLEAMRAAAVEDLVRALGKGTRPPADDYEAGVLGGFPEILRRYGLIYRGVIVAPELSVRALYKARWNSIHRRDLVEGMSPIELQAYWGWLALYGWGKPLSEREDALVAFGRAGGVGTQEAAALMDLLGGRADRAWRSLERLYVSTGQLRLRNLALGAMHAALFPATSIGTPSRSGQ
ncbi:MAG: hypothetical protein PVH21_12500 [Myxococcales bacterium]